MAGRKPNLHTPDRAKAPPQRGLMQLVESWDAYWDSPARADTLTLRGPSFFHSILLEVRGTPVAQR
jgi:hypothetical protein